jgi:hypothetical protein
MIEIFIGLLLAITSKKWQELLAIAIVTLIVCRSFKVDWVASGLISAIVAAVALVVMLVFALETGFR